jgi:hypothetical protein
MMEDTMRSTAMCRPNTPALGRWTAVMMMLLAAFLFIAPSSQAQSDDADKILKALSAYLASQKNISLSFDSGVEVITPDVQKIQFANSGHLQMSRPDKLRASRTGGYADVELVFDGKTSPYTPKTSTPTRRSMRRVRSISSSIS